ncbi:hypothetical protein V1512DRAFT_248480 [Lipomyces arxii]|uniref:uncharacterized protein n=1 Tax=Lipomyces arxii TaxID=56418 RepID=UPI0034CD909B
MSELSKTTRRSLFDEEIMKQIRLTSGVRKVGIKRAVRLQIACGTLVVFLLFCMAGEYAFSIHPAYLAYARAHSTSLHKRDFGNLTIADSFCIPSSNVVSNPTFVDFVNWTKTANYHEFKQTQWSTDRTPAGAFLHHYSTDHYPAPDYPKLMQKVDLIPGTEYTISMTSQFEPRVHGMRDHYEVSLHVLRARSFFNPLFTASSYTGTNTIGNGTFYGTFTAVSHTAYVLLMAGSFNYDSYFHKLTIHPSTDRYCEEHDPLNPTDLINVL